MDLKSRIRRRQRKDGSTRLDVDYDAIAPGFPTLVFRRLYDLGAES